MQKVIAKDTKFQELCLRGNAPLWAQPSPGEDLQLNPNDSVPSDNPGTFYCETS